MRMFSISRRCAPVSVLAVCAVCLCVLYCAVPLYGNSLWARGSRAHDESAQNMDAGQLRNTIPAGRLVSGKNAVPNRRLPAGADASLQNTADSTPQNVLPNSSAASSFSAAAGENTPKGEMRGICGSVGAAGMQQNDNVRQGRRLQRWQLRAAEGGIVKQLGGGQPVLPEEKGADSSDTEKVQASKSPLGALPQHRPDDENAGGQEHRETAGAAGTQKTDEEKNVRTPRTGRAKVGEKLFIAEDAKDMAFLEGVWRCNLGAVSELDTGRPIEVEFRFDRRGRGYVSIIEPGGKRYCAVIMADMTDEILQMQTSVFRNAASKDTYAPHSLECRQGSPDALCECVNGDRRWSNVTFTRIR